MDYIKSLPLPPPRCRSAPHQLPLATAVCKLATNRLQRKKKHMKNPVIRLIKIWQSMIHGNFLTRLTGKTI